MKLKDILQDFLTGWRLAFEWLDLIKDSYQDKLPILKNTRTNKTRPATIFDISPGAKFILPYKRYRESGVFMWTLDKIN